LLNESDSTVFHTIEWCNLLEKFLDSKPFFIAAIDKDNNIRAILPLFHVKNRLNNKLVSIVYSQYGGYIGDTKYFKPIINKSIDLRNKLGCTYISIKQPPNSKIDDNLFEEMGLSKKEHLDQYLILKDPEILWQEFSESTRRALKKVLKKDIIVKKVTEDSEVKKVHNLSISFGKKVGMLSLSYKDYLKKYKKLNELGISEIFIAKSDNKVISYMYLMSFNNKVLYESGASSSEGRKLSVHRLITLRALKWSYNKGYKIFDFGPSGPLDENEDVHENLQGLVDYKSFFNSIKTSYNWYFYPKNVKYFSTYGNQSWKTKALKKILRITPTFLLRRMGTFILKKII